jgi:uncharacterized protein with von Willebrand factor type A (vWA) domain
MTHEAGKGDKQRPTNHDAFSTHFEEIFGKKVPKELADAVNKQLQDALAEDDQCKKENPSA